jgi:hypothetical protein
MQERNVSRFAKHFDFVSKAFSFHGWGSGTIFQMVLRLKRRIVVNKVRRLFDLTIFLSYAVLKPVTDEQVFYDKVFM